MPSELTTPDDREFLRNLRAIKKTGTIAEACRLVRENVDEALGGTEKNLWNEVGRAHLLFEAIECSRHLQDMEYLLELADKIEGGIKEATLRVKTGTQAKEALMLLYKARVAAMHNRQEYGYLTLNLEAIEALFGKEGLCSLLEESREACKAYIAILCLCFHEQWDEEYQLCYSFLQTKLKEALELNEKVLVGKHGYHKYTPKLKVYSLRIRDELGGSEFDRLCEQLLKEYPTGKHALEIMDIRTKNALKMDLRMVPPLLEQQKKLTEEELVQAQQKLGKESESSRLEVTYNSYLAAANAHHYALWVKHSDEASKAFDHLASVRKALTGLDISEDYNFLMTIIKQLRSGSILETINLTAIDRFLGMIQELVKKTMVLGTPSCFGFDVLWMTERTQQLLATNFEVERASPHSVLFLGSASKYFRGVVHAHYLKEHRKKFQAYYSVFDGKYFINNFDSFNLEQLSSFRDSLKGEYLRLKELILKGTKTLSFTCGPIRFIEITLIEIMQRMAQMHQHFIIEMVDVQKWYLRDFRPSQRLPKAFYEGQGNEFSENEEEVTELIGQIGEDRLNQSEKIAFKLFRISMEDRAINKKLIKMKALFIQQAALKTKDSLAYNEISEKVRASKAAILANMEEAQARIDADQAELVGIFGKNHIIPFVHYYPLCMNKLSDVDWALDTIPAREKMNQVRAQMYQALARVFDHDLKMAQGYFSTIVNKMDQGLIYLHGMVINLNTANFNIFLRSKLQAEANLNDEEAQAYYKQTREAMLIHYGVFSENLEAEEEHLAFLEMQMADRQHPHIINTFRIALDLIEMAHLYYSLDVANYKRANDLFDTLLERAKSSHHHVLAKLKNSLFLYLERILKEFLPFRRHAEQEWNSSMVKYTSKLPSIQTTLICSSIALGILAVAWARKKAGTQQ